MPAQRTTSEPSVRRGRPAFNPPRPVTTSTFSKARPTISTANSSRARGTARGRTRGSSRGNAGFKSARTTIVNSDDEDEDEDEDENMSDAAKAQEPDFDFDFDSFSAAEGDSADENALETINTTALPLPPSESIIPPRLLQRLVYEGFEDKDMKIGREAMGVMGKYVETFLREAVARAHLERKEEMARKGGEEMEDGFLQVEDLERLAPQLVMDF